MNFAEAMWRRISISKALIFLLAMGDYPAYLTGLLCRCLEIGKSCAARQTRPDYRGLISTCLLGRISAAACVGTLLPIAPCRLIPVALTGYINRRNLPSGSALNQWPF